MSTSTIVYDSIKVNCCHIVWEACVEDWNGGLKDCFENACSITA